MPVDTFKVSGHLWIRPLFMSRDSSGMPVVYAELPGGIGATAARFDWADSTWVDRWELGYGVSVIWPDIAPPHQEWLLWKNNDDQTPPAYVQSTLVLAEDRDGVLSPPDTVTLVYDYTGRYSVAASERRRWVAVADRTPPRYGGDLRLFYSDTVRVWHEVPVPGSGDHGVALGVLDDTSAVLVWGGLNEGMHWGTLRGTQWAEGSELITPSQLAWEPQLRRDPRGGYWLAYSDYVDFYRHHDPGIHILHFNDGAWTRVDSIACNFIRDDPYTYDDVSLSFDDSEYPSIALSAFSNGIGVETVCACMATDAGFMNADEIQPSNDGGAPNIARDPNGDIWISWYKYYDGMFWTHTYETATTSAPRVVPLGSRRAIRWALSEPSPETWWAVLRARNNGPYEVAARVRAGKDTTMVWIDESPPRGLLSYKIRRECADVRYQWTSGEARWPAGAKRPMRFGAGPDALVGEGGLRLSGAVAGPVEVTLYDLQGRVVLRQRFAAGGTGTDRFQLDTGVTSRLSSGIYFLRARDASGRDSEPGRVVVLR